MRSGPKVSVVTIVRNDAQGFLITARSVLKQDYPNIEWIVVDGLSGDRTGKYIENLSPTIARYMIEADTGIYNAMNKGIDMVTGEWIVFMNADDAFYSSSTISTFVKNIHEQDDVLYSDVIRREDGKTHRYRPKDEYWMGMTFDHQGSFIKSSLYKKYKFDESYKSGGDLFFLSLLRSEGCTFRKIIGLKSCIKPFSEGVSSNYFDRQIERHRVLSEVFDNPGLVPNLHREFAHAYKSQVIDKHIYNKLMESIV